MRQRSQHSVSLPKTSITKESGVQQKMDAPVAQNKAVQPVANNKATHEGAGWYRLPNGDKVRGKAAVIAAGFTV
jgi:hypothetical protein